MKMEVRVSHNTAFKIREKHNLDCGDVLTVFDADADRVDFRTGETGISFGVTVSGKAVTVITVRKGNIRWIKTARLMTNSEKRLFRQGRR